LRERLQQVLAERGLPLVVTGIGSTMAVHVGTEVPDRFVAHPAAAPVRRLFHLGLLNDGQWLAARGMLATSLATTAGQVDELVAAVGRWADLHAEAIAAAVSDADAAARSHAEPVAAVTAAVIERKRVAP
jgi:glutamate-1-semialdehyde 2,1-aminomutase